METLTFVSYVHHNFNISALHQPKLNYYSEQERKREKGTHSEICSYGGKGEGGR